MGCYCCCLECSCLLINVVLASRQTFGDCYVASAGVPEPLENHAVHMARFAVDCRAEMLKVVRQMEVWLGPDTGDLSMKIGLHSGPVTGGVLRGERARFQLFGDTVSLRHPSRVRSASTSTVLFRI